MSEHAEREARLTENVQAANARSRALAEKVIALEARLAEAERALREILRHTGAPNVWDPGDGCQARLEGEGHDNCRPVIFDIARAALASEETA